MHPCCTKAVEVLGSPSSLLPRFPCDTPQPKLKVWIGIDDMNASLLISLLCSANEINWWQPIIKKKGILTESCDNIGIGFLMLWFWAEWKIEKWTNKQTNKGWNKFQARIFCGQQKCMSKQYFGTINPWGVPKLLVLSYFHYVFSSYHCHSGSL